MENIYAGIEMGWTAESIEAMWVRGKAWATSPKAQIHGKIARQGLLQNDIVLSGTLVDIEAKCGGILEARQRPDEAKIARHGTTA